MVFLTGIYLLFSFSSAALFNLDHSNEVSIPPLGSVYVELSSNPTTGFSWSIVNPNSEKLMFQSFEGTYNPPSPGSPRGTPGKQVFQIACNEKAKEGDVEHLTFVYKRPWEAIPGETRLIKVTITREV